VVSRIISKLPFNVAEKESCPMLTWIKPSKGKKLG
jgi:hypothetical protein